MIKKLLLIIAFFAGIIGVEVFTFTPSPVLRGITIAIYLISGIIVYYLLQENILKKIFWISMLFSILLICAVPMDSIPINTDRNEAILQALEQDIETYKDDSEAIGGWEGLLAKWNLKKHDFPKFEDFARMRRLVTKQDYTQVKFGTDLKGGFEILYEVIPAKEGIDASVEDSTLDIIRERINNSGLAGNTVQSVGRNRILVQVPGYNRSEVARVKSIIKKRGHLAFRLVSPNNAIRMEFEDIREENRKIEEWNKANPDNMKAYASYPEGYEMLELSKVIEKDDGTFTQQTDELLVATQEYVTGDDLANVYVTTNANGQPVVGMDFTLLGRKKMADVTGEHKDERLAIVLDGQLKSAPFIRDRIARSGTIDGDFTQQEIKEMIDVLRAGSLDIKMKELSEYSVEASLGDRSIRNGIRSVLFGAAAVLLFMAIYYLKSGLIADATLFFNLVLIVGTMSLFQVTLTLPGIAGLLLTIGMSVDANIIIFERIREEIARRKARKALDVEEIRQGVERGYKSAFWTIFDANITTLLTAVILLIVGTGAIKGFAITLSIGILGSMFAALVISRTIYQYFLGLNAFKGDIKMLGMLTNPAFTFVGNKVKGKDKDSKKDNKEEDNEGGGFFPFTWKAQTISIIIVIAALVYFFMTGSNKYGVDFNGGSITKVAFQTEIEAETLRQDLESQFPDLKVQRFYDPQKSGGLTKRTFSLYLPEVQPSAILTNLTEAAFQKKAESVTDFVLTDTFKETAAKQKWLLYNAADNGLIPLDTPRKQDDYFSELDEAVILRLKGAFPKTEDAAAQLPKETFESFALYSGSDEMIIVAAMRTEREKLKKAVTAKYGQELAPVGIAAINHTEGTGEFNVDIVLEKPMTADAIKGDLESPVKGTLVLKDVVVTPGEGNAVSLRIFADKAVKAHQLREELKTRLPISARFLGDNAIGSVVASELRERGIMAIVLSLIVIIVYITIRFEFNFSMGAVVALVHDVLITIGIILLVDQLGLMDLKIDLTILAAMLTIIGYSLNDTIVVFDRIREKFPLKENRHQKSQTLPRKRIAALIDQGINETLSRTIMTSLTTLLVTLSMLFLGGDGIQGFAFALTIGVVVGTYSSIFVASPVVILVHWLRGRKSK